MTTGSEYIERLKREARMLNEAGDWRGLKEVLEDLSPCFRGTPWAALDFYRELESQNNSRQPRVLEDDR